jgi:hypothetical protein
MAERHILGILRLALSRCAPLDSLRIAQSWDDFRLRIWLLRDVY